MEIELACYEPELCDKFIQEATFRCLEQEVSVLSLPVDFIGKAKEFLNGSSTSIAAIIDYPYGHSPLDTKKNLIMQSIRRGAKIIEVCLNMGMIYNDDFSGLKRELTTLKEIANNNKIEFRICLEYRLFNIDELEVICDFLHRVTGSTIITSCGMICDDPQDNLLTSNLISKRIKAKLLPASNLWQYKHLAVAADSKFESFRFITLSLFKRCIII